jgi:hypothetical protein
VSGGARLHRVPRTTGHDRYPSLFRGKLAYARSIGESRSVVRLGSLKTGAARTIWTNRSDDRWFALDTAVGAGNAIAFVTARDGAGNGAYRAYIAGPNRRAERVLSLNLGHSGEGGLTIEGVSRNGRRVTINSQYDDKSTDHVYALPSGRKVALGQGR